MINKIISVYDLTNALINKLVLFSDKYSTTEYYTNSYDLKWIINSIYYFAEKTRQGRIIPLWYYVRGHIN